MSSNQPPEGFDPIRLPPPDPSQAIGHPVHYDVSTLPPPQPNFAPERQPMAKSSKWAIGIGIAAAVLLVLASIGAGVYGFARSLSDTINTPLPPQPYYESNLIKVNPTAGGVIATWTVKNTGDEAGKWSCTVRLRAASGSRVGSAMVVAVSPLSPNQATRRETFVAMPLDKVAKINMPSSTVDCDEPW